MLTIISQKRVLDIISSWNLDAIITDTPSETISLIRKKNADNLQIAHQMRTLRYNTIFAIWKPFKNDEKCFLFHLKCSFRS